MEFKENNIENESLDNQYLKEQDFKELENIELIPYTGEGKTSYTSTYDMPKMQYLADIGVDTPFEWLDEDGKLKKESRALFVSAFIVTGNILVTESIRRTLGEDSDTFKEVLEERNRHLEESRVDKYGYRRVLPNGTFVENHFSSMNLSSNPEKRVSNEELHSITKYIFSQLRRE
ncbi:MAG: hypothetical protein RBS01_01295 [Candidatus Dojkabacteria bacterium]|jgi:hypothetical protein|nr:hypothetical protein [Candidatus Dojkabacteria bacterium]